MSASRPVRSPMSVIGFITLTCESFIVTAGSLAIIWYMIT